MNVVLQKIQNSKFAPGGEYLTQRHFHMMIAAAAAIHILALVIYSLLPAQDVMDIPVRVLNVKLAGASLAGIRDNNSSRKKQNSNAVQQAVPVKEPADIKRKGNLSAPAISANDTKAAQLKNNKTSAAVTAIESPDEQHKQHQSRKSSGKSSARDKKTKTLPAVAGTNKKPRRFIRSRDAVANSAGSIYGNSTLSESELVRRYEQILSLWIEQHKVYPVEARRRKLQGDALVRIRIDRNGNILRFRLEQATGHSLIDDAIGQMIAAANPVPAVPENYPAGKEIEFLVPVSFKVLE